LATTCSVLVLLEVLHHQEISIQQENAEWSQFSLAQAMQGLENDSLPEYTERDLKQKWQ